MSDEVKRVGSDAAAPSAPADPDFMRKQAEILRAMGVSDPDIDRTIGDSDVNRAIRQVRPEEPFCRFFKGEAIRDEDCFTVNINPKKFGESATDQARGVLTAGIIALLTHIVREADKVGKPLEVIEQKYNYDEHATRDVSAVLLLHRDAQVPGDFMDFVPVFGVTRPHPELRFILDKHAENKVIDGFAFKGIVPGGLFAYVSISGTMMDFSVDSAVFKDAEVLLFSSEPERESDQGLTLDDVL